MKTDSSTDSFTKTAVAPSKKQGKSAAVGISQQSSEVTEWLKALSIPGGDEAPGDEWKRRPDLEQLLNMGRSAVDGYLKKGIEAGTIEMRKFRIRRSDGSSHYLPHFRVVKKSV